MGVGGGKVIFLNGTAVQETYKVQEKVKKGKKQSLHKVQEKVKKEKKQSHNLVMKWKKQHSKFICFQLKLYVFKYRMHMYKKFWSIF